MLLQGCRRLHSSSDSCSRSAVPSPAGISKAEVKQRWHHHVFCPPDSPQAFLMPQKPLLSTAASPQRPRIQFPLVSQAMLSLLSHGGTDPLPLLCSHPRFPSTQTPQEAQGSENPTCTSAGIHQQFIPDTLWPLTNTTTHGLHNQSQRKINRVWFFNTHMESRHCPWRAAGLGGPGRADGHKEQVGDVGRDPTHNLIPACLYIHQHQPGLVAGRVHMLAALTWIHVNSSRKAPGAAVRMPSMGKAHRALASRCQLPSPPALGRILRWAGPQGPCGSCCRHTQHSFPPRAWEPGRSGCLHPCWCQGQLSPSPSSGSARQVQTPGPPGEVWPSSECQSRVAGRTGDNHHH